jgi:CheY-like chemotaxis protein
MGKRTVLVIDDDHDFRQALADVIEDAGHQVVTAANGRDALDLIEGGLRPDLILLDVMMPVMDGWHFLSARLAHPDIVEVPVVLMSALPDARRDARKVGACGFAAKPFHLTDVLRAMPVG